MEEEEQRLAEETEQLGQAVARRIGRNRLWGRALKPIAEVVRRFPDHTDQLYTLTVTVQSDILNPVEAADTFVAIAEAAAAAGWPHPHADRIAGLERRIATLESFDPDADQLASLRAELQELRRAAS